MALVCQNNLGFGPGEEEENGLDDEDYGDYREWSDDEDYDDYERD